MKISDVCLLIVTYNRKNYLLDLINRIFELTICPKKVLIFDNNSTDGTSEILQEKGIIDKAEIGNLTSKKIKNVDVLYYKNEVNSGGSGGFHKGISMARKENCKYIWCMDDDVLPEYNCLELLLEALRTYRVCIPNRTDENFMDYAIVGLNMSNPFKYTINARKKIVYSKDLSKDIVDVVDMPFEGPIFESSIVDEIGLPNKDLFIIFDDTDYAHRINKITKIGFVKNAILHKQIIPVKNNKSLMGWKAYYGVRNQYWFDIKYGKNIFVKFLRPRLNHIDLCCRALIKGKKQNIKVLKAALYDGTHNIIGKTVNPDPEFVWKKEKSK